MRSGALAVLGVSAVVLVAGCGGGGQPAPDAAQTRVPVVTTTPASTLTHAADEHRPHHSSPERDHSSSTPMPSSSGAPYVSRPAPAPATTTPPAPVRTTSKPAHEPTPTHAPSATKQAPSPCASTSETRTLTIENDTPTTYKFSSATVAIGCGGTVDITNHTSAPHTFSPATGGFTGSGNITPAGSASVRFFYTGTFGFYCSYHSYMKGKVTVG
jgi:plastocyanin